MEVAETVAVLPLNSTVAARRFPAQSLIPVLITILIFAALSSYCGIRSEGFISGDACIHYFSARYAFAHPQNFVDVWSRPLVTTLYAGPTWLAGREGIRIVSMLVAVVCGWLGWRIARGQGLKYPVLAMIFTLGQPLLFLHSFSEMTELPFAMVLGLAFVAWQEKKFWLAAVVVSLTPLARPEGFGIVAIVFLGLLIRGNWKQIFVLPVPVVLWDIAGWLLSDHKNHWWFWLKDSWPYANESLYGRGNILAFVMMLPMVVSPLILPATIVGGWQSISTRRSLLHNAVNTRSHVSPGRDERHMQLCITLTAALPLFVLIAHSVLYWAGKMASAGEPRYLIVVAPFWGVLSARGWEWAFEKLCRRHIVRFASAAVLAPPILVNLIYPAVPVPFWHDWESARQITAWYQSSPLRATHPKVATSHPGVYYFLDVNPYGSPRVQAWGKSTLHACPTDTILIWDPIFGTKNACAELTMELDEIRQAGWVEVEVPILAESGGDISKSGLLTNVDAKSRWHVFMSHQAGNDTQR